jgi:hypothetical protein
VPSGAAAPVGRSEELFGIEWWILGACQSDSLTAGGARPAKKRRTIGSKRSMPLVG